MDNMQQQPQNMQPQDPTMQPEDAGRGGDSVMAHMSLGEVVIPRAFVDDPEIANVLKALFAQKGSDIREFTVGDPANKINPDTAYPEFGFFKSLRKLVPILNINHGWNDFRDSLESSAAILGNYELPGSSLLTSHLVSKGAQDNLSSLPGVIAQGVSGLTGSGVGSSITGIPSAASTGGGWGNLGNAIGDSLGLTGEGSVLGTVAGTPVEGGVGPTQGSGVLGSGSRLANSVGNSLAGGGTGGGSSFAQVAGAIGGLQKDSALKKIQKEQIGANQQQQANLESFDPSGITSDPGYKFNLEQGQKGVNAALGAQGNLFSGRALQEAAKFNEDYANNAFKDYYQRWLTKTGAQNTLVGNAGDINANTTLARSNNLAQSLSNVFKAPVGGYDPNSVRRQLGLVGA